MMGENCQVPIKLILVIFAISIRKKCFDSERLGRRFCSQGCRLCMHYAARVENLRAGKSLVSCIFAAFLQAPCVVSSWSGRRVRAWCSVLVLADYYP